MNDDILTPSSQMKDKRHLVHPVPVTAANTHSTPPSNGGNAVNSAKRRRNVIRKQYEPKQFTKGTPPITQSPKYHKAINYSHRSRNVRGGPGGYHKFESISVDMDMEEMSPEVHHGRG